MSSHKDEGKNQIIEEKKEMDKFVEQQKNQVENLKSNISETIDNVDNTANEYKQNNQDLMQSNVNSTNKYQQQLIETFQSISENYLGLQKNIFNTYESAFSKIADNISKDYWNNFIMPEQYTYVYNENNKRMSDTSINTSKTIKDITLGYTEFFNRTMEIGQKYLNDTIQNYFDFVKKIETSYKK
jgi:hypothetical protein